MGVLGYVAPTLAIRCSSELTANHLGQIESTDHNQAFRKISSTSSLEAYWAEYRYQCLL